jgi:hypothetical protein
MQSWKPWWLYVDSSCASAVDGVQCSQYSVRSKDNHVQPWNVTHKYMPKCLDRIRLHIW